MLVVTCAGPLACTKGPTFRVAFADAHGMAPGDSVFAAGVPVGRVRDVRVVGDKAIVTFEETGKNRVAFHADACAAVMNVQGRAALYMQLGSQGTLAKGAAMPECDLVPKAMKTAVGQIGKALVGALGTLAKNVTPVPPDEAPCAKVSVRVTGTAPLPPDADGTQPRLRLLLEVDNASDAKVSFPAGGDAGFLDAKKHALEVDSGAAAGSWFMPFTVPAHGKHAVAVVFTDAGAKPTTLTADLGYGMLQSCRLQAKIGGR